MTIGIDDLSGGSGEGLTGFISAGVKQGLSGNAILGALREGGLGIRTQSFYEILGEVRASVGRAGDIANLNPETIPGDEMFSVWRQAPEGMNLYQIDMHVIDPTYGAITAPFSVASSENLTVEQAIGRAMDVFTTNADKYGQRVLGGMLVGLHRAG